MDSGKAAAAATEMDKVSAGTSVAAIKDSTAQKQNNTISSRSSGSGSGNVSISDAIGSHQMQSKSDRENMDSILRASSKDNNLKTVTIRLEDVWSSKVDLPATSAKKEAFGTADRNLAASSLAAPSASTSGSSAVAKEPRSGYTANDIAIEIESEGGSVYHSFVSAEQPVVEIPSIEATSANDILPEAAAESASIEQTERDRRQQSDASWWYNINDGMRNLAPYQKTMVILRVTLAFIRIVAGIIVLIVSALRHEHAQRPLQAFVIMYISRLAVYYPLYFNRKVHRFGISWPNASIAKMLQTLRKFLEGFGFVLFVLGNIWTFNDKSSKETAPLLYQISLTYIAVGYIFWILPILFVLLAITAFIILFTFSPSFRMKYSKKKGADFAQISTIPLVKYVDPQLRLPLMPVSSPPSLHGHENTSFVLPACPTAAQSTTSLHSNASRHRHSVSHIYIFRPFVRIAHRLTRSRRQRAAEMELYKKQLASPVKDFTPSDPEDHMCAICLSDYEDGEILRLLPCNHHMHQSCVDEWLHINRSCPLCKQEAVDTSSPSKDSTSDEAANTETAATTAANSGEAEAHGDNANTRQEACAPTMAQTPALATVPATSLPTA